MPYLALYLVSVGSGYLTKCATVNPRVCYVAGTLSVVFAKLMAWMLKEWGDGEINIWSEW